MVRKNNKEFIRNVIIGSVAGLMVLMVILFMILKLIFGNEQTATIYDKQPQHEIDSEVQLRDTSVILVHEISTAGVSGYDIKKNKSVNKIFTDTTRITDAYGNTIPISEITAGDIIEADSDSDSQVAFSISKSSKVQSWKKISGITIDNKNSLINVGGTSYKFSQSTMIIKNDGTQEVIANIGPYDIVSIQAFEDVIWSIKIEESSSSIDMHELPVSKGTMEIDYSRLINFSDITEPVKVIPGKHKIVIRMEGYEVISYELNLNPGEKYEMSLADAKKAYTKIIVKMYTDISDYEIKIGGKTYTPGQEINLEQGKYTIAINADGYKPWTKNVLLSKDTYTLKVSMSPIEEEEDTNNTQNGQNEEQYNEALEKTKTVTINTEPATANIYIDGEKKGQTPYTVTLTNGDHTVILEKEGYEVYNTTINIDSSSDQTSFLYVLTQK